jgi:putative ABC transport system permease protein
MKYLVLIWAGLWRKPARTILTSLSIVTAFLLYGALDGTMASFNQVVHQITGGSILLTVSRVNMGTGLPLAYRPMIERVDGVQAVDISQEFNTYYREPGNGVGVSARDFDHLRLRPWNVVSESALDAMQRSRTGTIVGRALAEKYGWHVGDRLPLKGGPLRKDRTNDWVFDIVGIWDVTADVPFGGQADQIWVRFDYFDEARALGNGTVNALTSLIANPSQATRIAADIDRLFANSPDETLTRSFDDMIRAEMNQITNIQLMIDVVLSAVLFTLLFVTGNAMMQSVNERIPELAVLKTYGYSDAVVASLVLVESLLLCVTSALIGLGLAGVGLFPLIAAAFKISTLPMAPSVIWLGLAIAVALACASALPPAWRAQRLEVVDALAGR